VAGLATVVRVRALASALTTLALLLAACSQPDGNPDGLGPQESTPQPSTRTGEPSDTEEPEETPEPEESEESDDDGPARPRVVGTVARNLAAPWGVTFLPDGTALVSERDTTRVVAIPAGGGRPREVGRLDIAEPLGESGVLGLAASPTYDEDKLVYAYVTTAEDNRVVLLEGSGDELTYNYALFNLAHALRLSGRPAEAIPLLEQRLEYPDQQEEVAAELEAAIEEAGLEEGGGGVAYDEPKTGGVKPGNGPPPWANGGD
jgi:hypothetical protein